MSPGNWRDFNFNLRIVSGDNDAHLIGIMGLQHCTDPGLRFQFCGDTGERLPHVGQRDLSAFQRYPCQIDINGQSGKIMDE